MAGSERRRMAFASALTRRLNRKTVGALATAALWQIANYAIPLATFPYLARVLGVHGFGVLATATAIASFGLLVTDWGFNLTATQAVARVRADTAAVSAIVWNTIAAKALLGFCACAAILLACGMAAEGPIREVVPFALLSVVASVFTIDWALRGVESIRAFTIASVCGRLVSIPATFLLVRQADDVALAALSSSLGAIASAALSLMLCRRLGYLRRPVFALGACLTQIREGAHVFASMAAVSIYTSCLTLVLSLTSGQTPVGLFNGAERLRRPVQSLLSPIELVFYPRLSALAATDHDAARALSIRITFTQGAASLVLSVLLFAFAPLAVEVVLGPGFEASVPVLRILSGLIFLIGINNALGIMTLLPFGRRRAFSLCTLAGAVGGAVLAFPLSWRWGAEGTAATAVGAELIVDVAAFLAARSILFHKAPRRPEPASPQVVADSP